MELTYRFDICRSCNRSLSKDPIPKWFGACDKCWKVLQTFGFYNLVVIARVAESTIFSVYNKEAIKRHSERLHLLHEIISKAEGRGSDKGNSNA